MNNGELLAFVFFLSAVLGIVFYLFFKQRSKRHKDSFSSDWRKFEKAISLEDIKGIKHYGELVLWNEYLDSSHLDKIISTLKILVSTYPELNKLMLNAKNKKLDWNTPVRKVL